jgi:hypothetical protein
MILTKNRNQNQSKYNLEASMEFVKYIILTLSKFLLSYISMMDL